MKLHQLVDNMERFYEAAFSRPQEQDCCCTSIQFYDEQSGFLDYAYYGMHPTFVANLLNDGTLVYFSAQRMTRMSAWASNGANDTHCVLFSREFLRLGLIEWMY